MDHSEASQMEAVERYVLGDLSVSEVEEFERHFFDCPQCSEELRALAMLRDNARAVFIEQSLAPIAASEPASQSEPAKQPERAVRARWWNFRIWVPAMAMVALAVLGGYEVGEHRSAAAPQTVAEFPLYAAARGEETVIAPPAGAQFYTLYLDKTWDRDFPSYHAAFVTSGSQNGSESFSLEVAAPAPGQAIHILVPVGELRAGRYTLVISAGGSEIARYPFAL